jgi:hypothetical protein
LKFFELSKIYTDFILHFLLLFSEQVGQECKQLNNAVSGLKKAGTNFFAARTAVSDWKGNCCIKYFCLFVGVFILNSVEKVFI